MGPDAQMRLLNASCIFPRAAKRQMQIEIGQESQKIMDHKTALQARNRSRSLVPIAKGMRSRNNKKKALEIVPVILAGGLGTRLWPLSRAMLPKQFVHPLGSLDDSLLGATLKRVRRQSEWGAPLLMCNNDHRFLLREEVERSGITPRALFLEPLTRNTGAAIAVAALYLRRHATNSVMLVLPADHMLSDERHFFERLQQAVRHAAHNKLVLFGVKPTQPHTGYGYIRKGPRLAGRDTLGFEVSAFVEKPDRATAEKFIGDQEYYWNSGIFLMRPEALLNELGRLEPVLLEASRAALAGAEEDLEFIRLDARALAGAPVISLDRAVLEKTSAAALIPLEMTWSDLGSWKALWEFSQRDEAGNSVYGDPLLHDVSGCFIYSQKSVVAAVGLKDLVIVHTPDAVLVADKERSQEVGQIVARLRESNRREHEQHTRNLRPWGFFDLLGVGERFQVKLLHVKPQAKLSLQMHYHRSEHWVVVRGTAKVIIDGAERFVGENQSVYISAMQWHRLENPGKVPLELIEVQSGAYLGEDDIVRSDDEYHRAAEETR